MKTLRLNYHFNNGLTNLNEIDLSNNVLESIDSKTFINLINSYHCILSIILKYHKNDTKTKEKTNTMSFISFLIKKILFNLNFYKNCLNNKDIIEGVIKDKEYVTSKLS